MTCVVQFIATKGVIIAGLISIDFLFMVLGMNYLAISISTNCCCCTSQDVRRLSRSY